MAIKILNKTLIFTTFSIILNLMRIIPFALKFPRLLYLIDNKKKNFTIISCNFYLLNKKEET